MINESVTKELERNEKRKNTDEEKETADSLQQEARETLLAPDADAEKEHHDEIVTSTDSARFTHQEKKPR